MTELFPWSGESLLTDIRILSQMTVWPALPRPWQFIAHILLCSLRRWPELLAKSFNNSRDVCAVTSRAREAE